MAKPIQNKEEIVLELFRIAIEKFPAEKITKETIVETYNYIHDNLRNPSEYVEIIDNIPRSE